MTVEIERKFVAAAPPPADQLGQGTIIRQGYLAEEGDVTVRVRMVAGSATLTVKGGRGLVRTEVEVPLDPAQATALWPHTDGRRIDKIRHRVVLDGGLVAEVDLYSGPLSGLCTVEVEFASEASAAAFVVPQWFGREVTGQARWGNAALARHGTP